MYEPQLREAVSQGDIFDDVPVTYVAFQPDGTNPVTEIRSVRAMMLTHDCEHDKQKNFWVVAAEIRPLSEIDKNSHGYIRDYRVFNAFYLEAIEGIMAESYVDLRRIDRLHKQLLAQRSQEHKKVISLTDEARLALQRHIAVFFGLGRK